jgi:transcription elongation factor GreA
MADAQPLRLLAGIQDRNARLDALTAVRTSFHDQWPEIFAEWLLHEQHPTLLTHVARQLELAAEEEMLDASLEAVFRNHLEHPAQFVWACEAMTADDCPEPILRRMTPSLLEKLPDALDRKEFGPFRNRAKSLLDGGQVAVRLILHDASLQQIERFMARMKRLEAVEPQRLRVLEQASIQAQGTGGEQQTPAFVATQSATDAKRAELKQLLEVEIHRTLKGIQAAAAEGDLRENFEYHMLRDRQELQSAKAAALQRDLARVHIVEPGAADTSRVNVGTTVHLADSDGTPLEPVTILGPWDSDVSRRIFASGSGVGQNLIGKTVGEEVEVAGVHAKITAITAWDIER